MRLLLDTHIWISTVGLADRLTNGVSKALQDPANELWLSPISIWETGLLLRKKRVVLQPSLRELTDGLHSQGIREAPITYDIAFEAANLDFDHRDPADLILVATARVLALTLVTADSKLQSVPHIEVLFNG